MDLDGTAAQRLEALSALTGESGLSVAVLDLARSALAAVPSCLALRVTMHGSGDSITVATPPFSARTVTALSSLRLEIAAATDRHRLHRVVFLAERAHAFVGFEKVLQWAAGAGSPAGDTHRIERLVVDGDLPGDAAGELSASVPNVPDSPDALDDQRLVDRAIGVLLSNGFTVEMARAELASRAKASHRPVVEEAHAVLRSLRRPR